MNATGYAVMVLLVVAGLGTFALFPLTGSVSTSGTLSTSSTTSTAVTSCSSNTTTQVTSTTVNGTYTSRGSQVKVDYVTATVYTDQSGLRTLRIEIGFTNVGNSDIFVPTGCGSSVNSTITSGASVVKTVGGAPRCLCAEYLSVVLPGQSLSEVDPGCWSGYYYQVVGSGTVSAKLSLSWYPDAQFNRPAGDIVINATFTIS